MKLYLVQCYQAYSARECKVTATFYEPNDTLYYKHDLIQEAEIELPDCYKIDEYNDIYRDGKHCPMWTEEVNGLWKTFILDAVERIPVLLKQWEKTNIIIYN